MDELLILTILPLLIGWVLDLIWGDPDWLPHPIVWFGKSISIGEKALNKGKNRLLKGALLSLTLILSVYLATYFLLKISTHISPYISVIISTVIVFYCLAGHTLIQEVKAVFMAVDISEEKGREQVARIVGRDTSSLNSQQIRSAALETLSENLSDGVIAPLFWYGLLGVPGMFAYKMINTLDSMIGYKNNRYKDFGCWAAHIDDIANYLPARITAIIMLVVSNNINMLKLVFNQGKLHSSPNSGYPEAALATILGCRFGGPNKYFGNLVDKPYIGLKNKILDTQDMEKAVMVNKLTEYVTIALTVILSCLRFFILQKIVIG